MLLIAVVIKKLFCHEHVPEMMLFLYVLYNTLFKHVNNKRTIYQASFSMTMFCEKLSLR